MFQDKHFFFKNSDSKWLSYQGYFITHPTSGNWLAHSFSFELNEKDILLICLRIGIRGFGIRATENYPLVGWYSPPW